MFSSAQPTLPELLNKLPGLIKSDGSLNITDQQIDKLMSLFESVLDNDAVKNLLNENVYFRIFCTNLPKDRIRYPAIHDFLARRKLWNIVSDHRHLHLRLQTVAGKQLHDGGTSDESVRLLEQSLRDFADASRQDYCSDIADIVATASTKKDNGQLPANNSITPGYARMLRTGYIHHLIAGLIIKIDVDHYVLILSDHGGENPLRMINVPAGKIQAVYDLLSNAKFSESKSALISIDKTIPEITGCKYEDIRFISRSNFWYGRCYIENYHPLLWLLMTLKMGRDEGQLLFKKYKLFLWQNTLNEFRQHFSGRMTVNDARLIRDCEAAIKKKESVIAILEGNLRQEMYPKRRKTFIEHCKDAYQKIYYNSRDTAKSRLINFFGLPTDDYEYDVISKKTKHLDAVAKFNHWIIYIFAGFIILPVKNIVKLVTEFFPYCLQKAAKMGLQYLQNERVNEAQTPSGLTKLGIAAATTLLHAGYYLAKIFRGAARIATSPYTSARIGWKIHPVLGVASALASLVVIGASLFFTLPLFAYTNSLLAAKLGLTAVAKIYTAIAQTFISTQAAMGGLMTVTSIGLLAGVKCFTDAIMNCFHLFIENTAKRERELAMMQTTIPSLYTVNQDAAPANSTLNIVKGFSPATNFHASLKPAAVQPALSNNNNLPDAFVGAIASVTVSSAVSSQPNVIYKPYPGRSK